MAALEQNVNRKNPNHMTETIIDGRHCEGCFNQLNEK